MRDYIQYDSTIYRYIIFKIYAIYTSFTILDLVVGRLHLKYIHGLARYFEFDGATIQIEVLGQVS